MTSQESIAVGIMGWSNSARTFHLPLILSLPNVYRLHTIHQRSASTAQDCQEVFPGVKRVETPQELVESLPTPGLVVVANANADHVSSALLALQHGKHVVVEKPMALSLKDVERLDSLAKEKGLVCAAFQNRRWDGDFLTLRSLLSDRKEDPTAQPTLGVPTYFESRFDRYRPIIKGGWREEKKPAEGGGVLWDLGAHLVDQALTLFGPPETITAFVRNVRGQQSPDVDDEFTLNLFYPPRAPLPPSAGPLAGVRIGGLHVQLGASCLAAHVDAEQPRFRVEGTAGSYVKRGVDPQEGQLKRGWKPATHEGFGVYEETEPAELKLGRLTTTAPTPAGAKEPTPAAPQLVVADIPTLPGTYLQFYTNIAESIHAVQKAASDVTAANEAVQNTLAVRPEHVALSVKTLILARKSAEEGRTVKWSEL